MNRKEFLKTSMLAAATIGTAPALMSWIPQHNWENYNFGSGPDVKDRLYQGPFPVYYPENFFADDNHHHTCIGSTTRGKQLINCYGMGLMTYITHDQGAPVVQGKTLDETIDGLAAFPLATKLYIRPVWKELQKKRGRLDFDDDIKITLEKAAKYNKRIAFRINIHVPQRIPRDPNIKPDYSIFMPNHVLEKVPMIHIKGQYNNREDWSLPEYHNPYFLEYFEEFMALLAEQWNGNNLIEFMDTFQFGFWGEGHAWPLIGHNFPSNSVAEETWIKLFEVQQKYWTKVPLVTNTNPDFNMVGNSEIIDRTIRSHNWLRTDSIMVENEQIEQLSNRPPWIAAKLEGWMPAGNIPDPDEDGLPPTGNLFDKSKDICANYMNLAHRNTNPVTLNNYHKKYPDVLTDLSQTIGFRVRPSWIWKYKADKNRDGLIFGMVNDGVSGIPGVLRLTLFNDRNPNLASGCLDPGYPKPTGVRQAAMILPEGIAWNSGIKVKAELEVKGVKYPVPFACLQPLNPDGSLSLSTSEPRRDAPIPGYPPQSRYS